MWLQKEIILAPQKRGFHLIDNEIWPQLPEIKRISIGMVHILILHTSASISLNEKADPSVRLDFESFFRNILPDNTPYFRHTLEGADDMTAHLKASLLGNSLTLPLRDGKIVRGTWQGIYLGEHRESGGSRRLFLTVHGEGML